MEDEWKKRAFSSSSSSSSRRALVANVVVSGAQLTGRTENEDIACSRCCVASASSKDPVNSRQSSTGWRRRKRHLRRSWAVALVKSISVDVTLGPSQVRSSPGSSNSHFLFNVLRIVWLTNVNGLVPPKRRGRGDAPLFFFVVVRRQGSHDGPHLASIFSFKQGRSRCRLSVPESK